MAKVRWGTDVPFRRCPSGTAACIRSVTVVTETRPAKPHLRTMRPLPITLSLLLASTLLPAQDIGDRRVVL